MLTIISYLCIATVEVVLQTFLGSLALCGSTPHNTYEPFYIMKEIKLSQGRWGATKNTGKYVALVDDEDYEHLMGYRWSVRIKKGTPYAFRNTNKTESLVNRQLYLHRVIMGVTDVSVLVDHIDGNPLNNQRKNLRLATYSQNNYNSIKHRTTTNTYKGVKKLNGCKTWAARINSIHIGCYQTEELAAIAYDAKAKELHGEFAKLNFP